MILTAIVSHIRAEALQQRIWHPCEREMRKLGYVLHDRNDSELIWDGERCEPSMEEGIDTYNDHRMALSFAPFAMKSGSLLINNPQVVTKSYPSFWQSLREAGFEVIVISD